MFSVCWNQAMSVNLNPARFEEEVFNKLLQGAKDEFLLAATAQNLRKLAKLIPMPQPAPAI